MVGRFLQEDVYRGDGLNLYAYCENNPVNYYDPSGYDDEKCNPVENGSDGSTNNETNANNILGKPVNEWSDEDIQRAADSIHYAQYQGDRYGESNPYTVSATTNGDVVVSAANNTPGPNARKKGDEIFGKGNVSYVPGGKGSLYDGCIDGDNRNTHHAEARGIQYMNDNGMETKGSRQATTSYSCGPCANKQKANGVNNITGNASDHNNTYKR